MASSIRGSNPQNNSLYDTETDSSSSETSDNELSSFSASSYDTDTESSSGSFEKPFIPIGIRRTYASPMPPLSAALQALSLESPNAPELNTPIAAGSDDASISEAPSSPDSPELNTPIAAGSDDVSISEAPSSPDSPEKNTLTAFKPQPSAPLKRRREEVSPRKDSSNKSPNSIEPRRKRVRFTISSHISPAQTTDGISETFPPNGHILRRVRQLFKSCDKTRPSSGHHPSPSTPEKENTPNASNSDHRSKRPPRQGKPIAFNLPKDSDSGTEAVAYVSAAAPSASDKSPSVMETPKSPQSTHTLSPVTPSPTSKAVIHKGFKAAGPKGTLNTCVYGKPLELPPESPDSLPGPAIRNGIYMPLPPRSPEKVKPCKSTEKTSKHKSNPYFSNIDLEEISSTPKDLDKSITNASSYLDEKFGLSITCLKQLSDSTIYGSATCLAMLIYDQIKLGKITPTSTKDLLNEIRTQKLLTIEEIVAYSKSIGLNPYISTFYENEKNIKDSTFTYESEETQIDLGKNNNYCLLFENTRVINHIQELLKLTKNSVMVKTINIEKFPSTWIVVDEICYDDTAKKGFELIEKHDDSPPGYAIIREPSTGKPYKISIRDLRESIYHPDLTRRERALKMRSIIHEPIHCIACK